MGRSSLAMLLILALVLVLPAAPAAQTKDDTIVYALQSDVDSWDPPNSVLREAIILGYHVFDHLAVRDLKTGRVVPHLRPRAQPREQAHRARQPRQDQERRGRERRHGALQDRRPLPALRRADDRPSHAVRQGDQGEGPPVDAGEPDRHGALQARPLGP